MMNQVMALATSLQVLFTTTAEELGRLTGFIRRQRRLSAAAFAQTLVFRWIADPHATLESMAPRLDLSPQALHQRLSPKACDFLKALLAEALRHLHRARAGRLGLLDRFSAAVVEDTTTIPLPADLAEQFPGCGGSTAQDGAAALKVLIRWDVKTGQLLCLSVHGGRTADRRLAAAAADLPAGAVHLADQGFFDTRRWAQLPPDRYWISRVPAATCLAVDGAWQALAGWLGQLRTPVVDRAVQLVEKTALPCRLVALRCPPEVAARRRQKLHAQARRKKGREPSRRQLLLCDWLVFATNVPPEKLSAQEVWVVYRCRWQIELLFKRAKGQLGWAFSRGRCGWRVLAEVYAKLLGLVVVHWGALLRGGPLAGVSPTKLLGVVQQLAGELAASLGRGVAAVQEVLLRLVKYLARVRRQPCSRKKPSTRQRLFKPKLAA